MLKEQERVRLEAASSDFYTEGFKGANIEKENSLSEEQSASEWSNDLIRTRKKGLSLREKLVHSKITINRRSWKA